MIKLPRVIRYVALVGITVAALAGCSGELSKSVSNDQKATNTQLELYQTNQPVPLYDWSQYRQTILDIEQAQVHGIATTTFFFNQGVQQPIKACPSIGFPVASTAQLTNPSQVVRVNTGNQNWVDGVVGQQEPNGVYTGDSSGTYVVCVASNGIKYVTYWEGYVHTEGGPAHWDPKQNMIVLDGAPTVKSTAKK